MSRYRPARLGSASSGRKVSAMNAPWMNTAGSPLPETSYSSSPPSVLTLSNRCLPLGTSAASGVLPKPALRPHSTRVYAYGRPYPRGSSPLLLWTAVNNGRIHGSAWKGDSPKLDFVLRLSEKGCARRSERGFGRYMESERPFWRPVRLPSQPFRDFSDSFLTEF